MKTRLLFLVLLVFSCEQLSAQYYYNAYILEGENPGGLNTDNTEPWGAGGSPGWNLTNGIAGNLPVWSEQLTLPFGFSLNGLYYNNIYVSNSGVVTFSESVGDPPEFGNVALPHPAIPDNSICILGLTPDWDLGSSFARVLQKTFGEAPNRQYWIQFNSFSATADVNSAFYVFSIVLEEGSNNIYIVDQRAVDISPGGTENLELSIGIQIDNQTSVSLNSSPETNTYSSENPKNNTNTYYKFIEGQRPEYDLNLRSLQLPEFAVTGSQFTPKAIIRNFGTETLTSAIAEISSGEKTESEEVELPDIQTHSIDTIDLPPQAYQSRGKHSFTVTFTEPNGHNDARPEDNQATRHIIAEDIFPVKHTLVEVFTSSVNPQSYTGSTILTEALSMPEAENHTMISYPANVPGTGDPYYTLEGGERLSLYNISHIPSVYINGQTLLRPQQESAEDIAKEINRHNHDSSQPALMSIEATASLQPGQTINYDIDITPYTDYIPEDVRLYKSISEKATHNNEQSSGQSTFPHVMKKMLPAAEGSTLPKLYRGEKVKITGSYTFSGDYRLPENALEENLIDHETEHSIEDFENLELIVFIQNPESKHVYQSTRTDVTGGVALPEKINRPGKLLVHPNPASQSINLTFPDATAQVHITSIDGRTIYHHPHEFHNGQEAVRISTSEFSPGIYIITVTGNTYRESRRVSIYK